jgi:WD40 repeat protein
MARHNAILYVLCITMLCSAVPPHMHAELCVVRRDGARASVVLKFDDSSGTYLNQFAGDTEAFVGMAAGPDGNLYAAGNTLGAGTIFRFNRAGKLLGSFNQMACCPLDITFGPDGKLYAICYNTNWTIARYNAETGAFVDYFATQTNRQGVMRSLTFGPGNNSDLFVVDDNFGVLRFDGRTGTFIGTFVPPGSGGLTNGFALKFGSDANLYVSSQGSHAILRYNGTTGAFIDSFVLSRSGGLASPRGLTFGPDGRLYVCSCGSNRVLRFDGQTGAFLDAFVTGPPAELYEPSLLLFIPSAPRLQLRAEPGSIRLSWSAAIGPWSLYSSSSLQPTSEWTAVTNTPAQVGTDNVVTTPATGAAAFFRLQQP